MIRWPVPAFLVGVPRLGLGRRNRQGKLVQLGGAGLCGRVLVADDVVHRVSTRFAGASGRAV